MLFKYEIMSKCICGIFFFLKYTNSYWTKTKLVILIMLLKYESVTKFLYN